MILVSWNAALTFAGGNCKKPPEAIIENPPSDNKIPLISCRIRNKN